MEGYREGGRSTCSTCGRALTDEQLEITAAGRLVCPACRAEDLAQDLDRRGVATTKAKSRFMKLVFASGLVLLVVFVGYELSVDRAEREAERKAAVEKAAWASRIEPIVVSMRAWKRTPDQKCDDAALASRVSPGGEPWFAHSAYSVDGRVFDSMSRETPHPERFEGAQLVVAAEEKVGDRQSLKSVIVFDLRSGLPLCWALDDADVRNGVIRISSVVRVRD